MHEVVVFFVSGNTTTFQLNSRQLFEFRERMASVMTLEHGFSEWIEVPLGTRGRFTHINLSNIAMIEINQHNEVVSG